MVAFSRLWTVRSVISFIKIILHINTDLIYFFEKVLVPWSLHVSLPQHVENINKPYTNYFLNKCNTPLGRDVLASKGWVNINTIHVDIWKKQSGS